MIDTYSVYRWLGNDGGWGKVTSGTRDYCRGFRDAMKQTSDFRTEVVVVVKNANLIVWPDQMGGMELKFNEKWDKWRYSK